MEKQCHAFLYAESEIMKSLAIRTNCCRQTDLRPILKPTDSKINSFIVHLPDHRAPQIDYRHREPGRGPG